VTKSEDYIAPLAAPSRALAMASVCGITVYIWTQDQERWTGGSLKSWRRLLDRCSTPLPEATENLWSIYNNGDVCIPITTMALGMADTLRWLKEERGVENHETDMRSQPDYHRDRTDRRSRSPSREHRNNNYRDDRSPANGSYGRDNRDDREERPAPRQQSTNNGGMEMRANSQQERRVYVGNLAYDVKWHHLKDYMREGTSIITHNILLGTKLTEMQLATFCTPTSSSYRTE
jgi:hypothetical protein